MAECVILMNFVCKRFWTNWDQIQDFSSHGVLSLVGPKVTFPCNSHKFSENPKLIPIKIFPCQRNKSWTPKLNERLPRNFSRLNLNYHSGRWKVKGEAKRGFCVQECGVFTTPNIWSCEVMEYYHARSSII